MSTLATTVELPRPSVRARLNVRGAVQGVGFRPYVYRLATALGLSGFVRNDSRGVSIEVEGVVDSVNEFVRRLPNEAPSPANVENVSQVIMTTLGTLEFRIGESQDDGVLTANVMPDLAMCSLCLSEMLDSANRRYRYPFTNCMQCGPRFTIIESIPYDRENTSMRRFRMCRDCRAEYDDPANRRFHAQPNACPACGPQLALWTKQGVTLASRDEALLAAAQAVRLGEIVAVKGIGGFHLMVDARNEDAVRRLREQKNREEKPLALMIPNMAIIRQYCSVSEIEEHLLRSSAAPIVLLRRTHNFRGDSIAPNVAPGNPNLGIMLPYSPLHHLLMNELRFPIVATSGNRSDEPICIDEHEALSRLAGIADCFLVHDRPIVRPVDDSVTRVAMNTAMILRRSRGYVPAPICGSDGPEPILAVGGHLKNTVAVASHERVFLSQHIGDLATREALCAFENAAMALQNLYRVQSHVTACDMHPDYASSQYARRLASRVIEVQPHHAHIAACMAEHDLQGEVLGVCWDGTGFGPDNTVWGGEFLRATREGYQRVAHLRPFSLPGGSSAVDEPRRSALGLLYEAFGPALGDMSNLIPIQSFSATELRALMHMIERGINSPRTTSMGRLFDGIAALIGIRQRAAFEGQAAMELEYAAADLNSAKSYPFELSQIRTVPQINWEPMLRAIVKDLRSHISAQCISTRFHRTLIDMIGFVAKQVAIGPIVLAGGCFQNLILLEGAINRLRLDGREVYWPQRVPTNDGGLALGQAVVAGATLQREEH
ncbi:MAG: carbamoyltransferase HypF [Planctomycetes bacterium]|nr:carbamoyltransferase HypF [Planctomycetota bacterium]